MTAGYYEIDISYPLTGILLNSNVQLGSNVEFNLDGTLNIDGNPGSVGQVLSSQGTGTVPAWINVSAVSGSMIYPSVGIANSTGTSWGTSYSVSGSGSVVLNTNPVLVAPTLGTVVSANFSSGTFTWPTFNQNTTGTANTANYVPYTGLTGTVPTWNQNTTGNAGGISGILPISNGGTGTTISTGSGSVVLNTNPVLVAPTLGTVVSANFSSGTFTWPTFNQNTTGTANTANYVPYTGLTGTVPTWNQNTTGTAAGLSSVLVVSSGGTGTTISTGSGAVVLNTNPVLVSPTLGVASGTSLNLSGDLNVTGNVYIAGNTTTISANNLSIADSLIYLADGNIGNVADIGFVGHFNDGTYQHTGLVRDHTAGIWKLFSHELSEPTSNTINLSSVTYDTLQAGSVVAVNGLYSSNNYTGAYSDGIIVDYVDGTGRISVGASDGISFYNGGVGSNKLMSLSTSGVLATGSFVSSAATGISPLIINSTTPVANLSIGGTANTANYVPFTGLTGSVPTWNQSTTGKAAGISGILPTANGGTGTTISTGSGAVVLNTNPVLISPTLGTVASANLTSGSIIWPHI